MKNLLTLITFFIVSTTSAQVLKFEDLQDQKQSFSKFDEYIASNGMSFKIGDRIKIGLPSSNKTFAYIHEGDGILTPMVFLRASAAGTETEIKKVWVAGNKRTGRYVTLRTKGLTGLANYTIQVENALETGEIRSNVLSSDEALSMLKKEKDKLDLGLITQEEFDAKKAELSPYIN